ncbi:VWA domain-containing protein [Actibacterium sp. 188UL27-1]|uniref:VWA domain-containing protein n=1 Tax=Actibacterium sp. 188UL27-1 TaxID=2786961 RepID=UPI00195B2041|nr:VWA domain-containing protein [Actibacterium sp. 188UL27-1]MBM7065986.1 VWA domain-containing protein [Actibacterium sp. 188UL27-1]
MTDQKEHERRWRMALGETEDAEGCGLTDRDIAMSGALDALYQDAGDGKRRAGLSKSAPKVSRWLGDIREYFPGPVVQVIQKDAFERLGLQQMLLQPEFLEAVEADVHLVADLISLRSAMPEKTIGTARTVVQKVVDDLMERLEKKTSDAIRGAVKKAARTNRPRFADIDWPRTIRANLQHYQADYQTVVPEKLVGFLRQQRRLADLDEVVLCVDQSGSMATSVVYSSIFAAVMASIPSVATKLVCFDTAIIDLTEDLEDPVKVLFGVQLGGGTDINRAVAYCEDRMEKPSKTHFLLITDLMEGGDAKALIARLAGMIAQGVNVIVLLALTDEGRPYYDSDMAAKVSALGAPVFACTPDQFPDLMATALARGDIQTWAAGHDIKTIRQGEPDADAGQNL